MGALKSVSKGKKGRKLNLQSQLIAKMTESEKCAYLINNMRVYARKCRLEDLRELYSTLDIDDGEGLLLADTKDVVKFLKPILSEFPNVDKLQYVGLFVDTVTGQKFKEPDDAIAELARRMERIHLFKDTYGNTLPSEMHRGEFINSVAEADIKKFVSMPIFPITYKLTFKDKKPPVFLQFREDGRELLPLVVTGKEKEVSLQSMKRALLRMKEDLV